MDAFDEWIAQARRDIEEAFSVHARDLGELQPPFNPQKSELRLPVTAILATYPDPMGPLFTRQDAERYAEKATGIPMTHPDGEGMPAFTGYVARAWVEGDEERGQVCAEIREKHEDGPVS